MALAPSVPARAASHNKKIRELQGAARIQHALDRLTFGARPGELASVKAMGLHAWIQRQLHPNEIDDSALDARLQAYPALHMSVPQLMRQVPPPPLTRKIMRGKAALPTAQPLRTVYETQISLIQMRQQARAAKLQNAASQQQSSASASGNSTSATGTNGNALYEQHGQRTRFTSGTAQQDERQILADLQTTSVVNLPPQQRWQKILAMQPMERISFYRDLSYRERIEVVAGWTPQQSQQFSAMFAPVRTIASQVLAAKMLRVVDSDRQLQQVMTDFWLNHFNVDIHKSPLMAYYLPEYEDQVIRPRALGNFEDLLVAVAQSRAMLLYLDNSSSVGPHSPFALRKDRADSLNSSNPKPAPGINENYGRELMELHTVGVNGGYTQKDVIEVAKVFAGWTIAKPLQGGGFVFNPRRHEPGTKYVLGHAIHENGEKEGLKVLHILATSPATAHHISEELAERFVSDHPPQSLVDRMAHTFLSTNGNIRSVLETLFASPEFWATSTVNAKVKTPLEFVASAARAGNSNVQRPLALAISVARLGMPLYACQPPTGYSTFADDWVSSGAMVERMNFAMAFAQNRLPGVANDWDTLLGGDAASMSASQKQSALENILLPRGVNNATNRAIAMDLSGQQSAPVSNAFRLRGLARAYIVPAAESTLNTNSPHRGHMGFQTMRQPFPTDRDAAMIAGLLLGSPDFQTH